MRQHYTDKLGKLVKINLKDKNRVTKHLHEIFKICLQVRKQPKQIMFIKEGQKLKSNNIITEDYLSSII